MWADASIKINRNAREITRIETQLRKAELVEDLDSGIIQTGSIVILTKDDGSMLNIKIVASMQSSTHNGNRIVSYKSPLEKLLLGKKKGDKFEFNGSYLTVNKVQ